MNRRSLFLFLLLALPLPCEAKRSEPKEVAPVVSEGVEYRANNRPHDIAVEAYDHLTGKLLWKKEVYHDSVDPRLEEDLQWVFISELSVKDGKLKALTEDGRLYELNLETHNVTIVRERQEP